MSKRVESMQVGVDIQDSLRAEVERLRKELAIKDTQMTNADTLHCSRELDLFQQVERLRLELMNAQSVANEHWREVERLNRCLQDYADHMPSDYRRLRVLLEEAACGLDVAGMRNRAKRIRAALGEGK